jgi:hypothetical protein
MKQQCTPEWWWPDFEWEMRSAASSEVTRESWKTTRPCITCSRLQGWHLGGEVGAQNGGLALGQKLELVALLNRRSPLRVEVSKILDKQPVLPQELSHGCHY